jgi:hypothetical protein
MEFSPDGRRLLASGDGMRRLWDSVSGAEVLSIRQQGMSSFVFANSLRFFSRDGHKIWAGLDEKDHLWGWDATPLDDTGTLP